MFTTKAKATRNSHEKTVDIDEYRRAFQFFDRNNDGFITAKELEIAMQKCGVYPTKAQIMEFMYHVDKDRNGVLDFHEFLEAMRIQNSRAQTSKAELRKQFRLFDKDNDGFIELCEMNSLLEHLSLNKNFPPPLVNKIFREADVDGDGRISFAANELWCRSYLEFATAPWLEIVEQSDWNREAFGALFAWPAVRDCAILQFSTYDVPRNHVDHDNGDSSITVGRIRGIDADEVVNWRFSTPKWPYSYSITMFDPSDEVFRRRYILLNRCYCESLPHLIRQSLERKIDMPEKTRNERKNTENVNEMTLF